MVAETPVKRELKFVRMTCGFMVDPAAGPLRMIHFVAEMEYQSRKLNFLS
jgi:hypothetical protein